MNTLSDQERERYLRQIILPDWGEAAQERLKNATVFVAGAGGLGSPVAFYLAAAGVGTVRICDPTTPELSNLNRQILHSHEDFQKTKADSAGETLSRLNPEIQIVCLSESINADTVDTLVGEAQLIIDCLDNFETRYILNAYAVRTETPFIHAGVTAFSGQISFIHPPETACLACIIPEAPDASQPDARSDGVAPSRPPSADTSDPGRLRGAKPFPILGATAGVLGCLQAMEALKYLSGSGKNLKGRLLFFEGENLSFQELVVEKDPACPVCGAL